MENQSKAYISTINMLFKSAFFQHQINMKKIESIKKVLGLLISEFLQIEVKALSKEELIQRYTISQVMSNAMFNLLCFEIQELETFIEKRTKEVE